MKITAKTKICMVIGDPVGHSLSPTIFNAGFEKLGINDQFVFVGCTVPPDKLEDFMKGARAMNIHGISCTIPHKLQVMKYLDEVDEKAQKIGAVNTIVNDKGKLKGFNTDWLGAVNSIEKIVSLKGKKVALLGAGGAGKAVAYGVISRGAQVAMLFNRNIEKAQEMAGQFDISETVLNQLEKIRETDIIINTTSVGMHSNEDETLVDKNLITSRHIVFDIVYNPLKTRLLEEAEEQGAKIILGSEMFLAQAAAQFKLYTGHDAPEEAMKAALLEQLKIKNN